MQIKDRPTINLTTDVKKRLRYYAAIAPGEISMHGKSHVDKASGNIVVTDIAVLPQKCTAAHTIIDDEDTMKWTRERRAAGDDMKDWNVWIHTHGHMGVYWSSTDTDTMKDQAPTGAEMLVSIVTNKANDYKGRIDFYFKDPLGLGKKYQHSIDDVTVAEGFTADGLKELEEKESELKSEIETIENERVRIKEYEKELDDKEITLLEKLNKQEEERFIDEELEEEIKKEIEEKIKTDKTDDSIKDYGTLWGKGRESLLDKLPIIREYCCPECFSSFTENDLIGQYCMNITELENMTALCPKCKSSFFDDEGYGIGKENRNVAKNIPHLSKKKMKKLAKMTEKQRKIYMAKLERNHKKTY